MKTIRHMHDTLLSIRDRVARPVHDRSPHARAEAFARRMRALEFARRIRHHGPASELGVVVHDRFDAAGMVPAALH